MSVWRYRLERDFVLEHPVFDDIAFVNDWCELKLNKAQVVGVWRDMLSAAQWPLTGIYTKAVDWFGPQDFYNAG